MQVWKVKSKEEKMQTGHGDLEWFGMKLLFVLLHSPSTTLESYITNQHAPSGKANRTQAYTRLNDTKRNVES